MLSGGVAVVGKHGGFPRWILVGVGRFGCDGWGTELSLLQSGQHCGGCGLGGGYALDEVILFTLGFGADGDGVEDAGTESEADGFGGFVAEVALAEDLHANDAGADGAHLLDEADDGVGVGVHVGADGVEADEVDIDPGVSGGETEGGEGVAGDAVGADDAFFLGFGEDVHDGAIAGGPVRLGDAMDEDNVEVVDSKLAAEAVEVGADAGWIAGVGFGEDGNSVARELFDGSGDEGVRAVGVGGVEEAEAVGVIAVEQEAGERGVASLVGAAAEANGAGAHGKAAGADAGATEDDFILSGEPGGERGGIDEGGAGDGGGGEPGGTKGAGGAAEEVSAEHAGRVSFRGDCTPLRGCWRRAFLMGWREVGKAVVA